MGKLIDLYKLTTNYYCFGTNMLMSHFFLLLQNLNMFWVLLVKIFCSGNIKKKLLCSAFEYPRGMDPPMVLMYPSIMSAFLKFPTDSREYYFSMVERIQC